MHVRKRSWAWLRAARAAWRRRCAHTPQHRNGQLCCFLSSRIDCARGRAVREPCDHLAQASRWAVISLRGLLARGSAPGQILKIGYALHCRPLRVASALQLARPTHLGRCCHHAGVGQNVAPLHSAGFALTLCGPSCSSGSGWEVSSAERSCACSHSRGMPTGAQLTGAYRGITLPQG